MKIEWQTKTFEELSKQELFDVLELRQDVFVVEQACAYPDIDSKDLEAWHLIGRSISNDKTVIVAYSRLLKPGVSYTEASIGRVLVSRQARGQQIGRQLMKQALKEMNNLFPNQAIQIGAQEQLTLFYQSLGFNQVSPMYLEDGIPHIDMLRS